jgi:hypothetical protein
MIDAVITDPDLNSTAVRVLVFIIRKAGPKGEMWWRQTRIASALSLSVDQLQRYLKLFDATGRLQNVRIGLGRSNRYRLPWYPAFAGGKEIPLRPSCAPAAEPLLPLPEKEQLSSSESAESARFPETASVRLPIKRKEKGKKEQKRALTGATGIVAPSPQTPARNFRHRQTPPPIQCSPEEFERLRNFVHEFARTDRNWNRLPTPGGPFLNPPDDAITARIAEPGGWNIPEIIRHFRAQKEAGKKPEISYGWFEYMIKATWNGITEAPPHPLRAEPQACNGMRLERQPKGASGIEWVPAVLLYPTDGEGTESPAGCNDQNPTFAHDSQPLAVSRPPLEPRRWLRAAQLALKSRCSEQARKSLIPPATF